MADFVFLHGGGQGSWVWDEAIAALEQRASCRTLALDAPGCGVKRARNTEAMTFEDLARELVADIAAGGMRDVALVGHSQAGAVMPLMAQVRPDLIGRLVFVACSAPLPGQTIQEMIGSGAQGANAEQVGWYALPGSMSDEARRRTIFCHDMGADRAQRLLEAMNLDRWPASIYRHRDWRYDHLAAIPSFYIAFLRDRALPLSWQERFAARLHADQIVRIDAGHQGMMTRPGEFAAALAGPI